MINPLTTQSTITGVSKCCNSNVIVSYGNEGTNCYICEACGKPTDVITKPVKRILNKTRSTGKELDFSKEIIDYIKLSLDRYVRRYNKNLFNKKKSRLSLRKERIVYGLNQRIQSLLTQQRTELIKEIRKMETSSYTLEGAYRNETIKDIINSLNK